MSSREIEPLRRPTPASDSYPVEALGKTLSDAVAIIGRVIQAPDALISQSFLAGAALSVQGNMDLSLNSSTIPLSDFFLTIAESGERKSAVDKFATAPHKKWQKEQYSQYKLAKDRFDIDLGRHKKEISSDKPTPPRCPMLLCEEPTAEGLFKQLSAGIPTIGIFSDEGGQMIGGHAMTPENRLKTSASLSKLWDGSELSRVRSGDGSELLYGRRCSVHLMIQPKAAATFLEDGISEDQGILSRFLVTHPTSTKGDRGYVDEDLQHSPALDKYNKHVTRLLDKCSWHEGSGELELGKISLSNEAKKIWIKYHDQVEAKQIEEGEYRIITGLASKAAEHAARLAGIIQVFDNPDSQFVDPEHIEMGITLMNYYLKEAIRLKSSASVAPEIIQAEKLLAWFKSEGLKEIYPRKVYQFAPGSLRTKAKAAIPLKILEDHGYLIPIPPGQKYLIDGKVRKVAWRIAGYYSD